MTVPLARPAAPRQRTRSGVPRLALGVVLVVFACLMFANVDIWLAWDDANPTLGHGRLLLYFTTQSNLLAVIALTMVGTALLRGRRPTRGSEYLRGLATVDMAISGLVASILLTEPGAPFTYSDFLLHQAGPALMVLWWVIMPPTEPVRWSAVFVWLTHPLLWTLCVLTYGAESSDGWVPYFFLSPDEPGGWGAVAISLLVIHLLFAVLAVGVVSVSRFARWRGSVWRPFDAHMHETDLE
ncbi:Pr6Pr family membrane protein [Sphaerimonospora cavernae]|uniref:Pr6Pr family membrane protein n=1 Tax=Sphaerimonospora cavernae TaxID=1740611 RepID=A0ABV6U2I2_9ACTN